MKKFNILAQCIPSKHYMVNIDERLAKIKEMVDDGEYFVINRSRQYGKTTTLWQMREYLQQDYAVIHLDFQEMGHEEFSDVHTFCTAFAELVCDRIFGENRKLLSQELLKSMEKDASEGKLTSLRRLFRYLNSLCDTAAKPVVLMIDEVDNATNNQIFLDFLAQLRANYIQRESVPTFQSVVLAGVYDIRNLKRKIRSDEKHKVNSPWNVAAPFEIDMSLSEDGIAGMLREYEGDHHTGMDVKAVAKPIREYTEGYPYLVSAICKIIDEKLMPGNGWISGNAAWSEQGVTEAVKIILHDRNTLFDSLIKQVESYPELKKLLWSILFEGKDYSYGMMFDTIRLAEMLGFVREKDEKVVISNRIFETMLYDLFIIEAEINGGADKRKGFVSKEFIVDGRLDMEMVLRRFTKNFQEVYGGKDDDFVERQGRMLFLLYLKPIINGTGNYYVEAETRDARRTDIIVDYLGERFIIELKIWRGEKYQADGEKQLAAYLDSYGLDKGYLLTFCFNRKKETGVEIVHCSGKTIVEAIV